MAAPTNRFTLEEIEILRKNPNVSTVSTQALSLTTEFREKFWLELQHGKYPKEILREDGFDLEILGYSRVRGTAQNIRKEYAEYGDFSEQRHKNNTKLQSLKHPERRIANLEANGLSVMNTIKKISIKCLRLTNSGVMIRAGAGFICGYCTWTNRN
jgi:hypothetical protein